MLDQNYRSTQTILDAANAVIANNPSASPRSCGPTRAPATRIIRYHAEDEGDEATWVARTMQHLHDATPRACWSEMAVFYRTNAQSRVIEEALMRFGIPYKVVGGTRFYDRREIKDAMAYLRAVVNPADEVSVKRVLNVPKRGVGDTSVGQARRAAADGNGVGVRRRAAARRRGRRHRAGRAGHRSRSSTLLDDARRRARPTSAGPADLLQAALDARGYLAELEAETHGRGRRAASRTSASWSARPGSSRASTSSSSRSRWWPTPTSSTTTTRRSC